jgi:hypothetical protein
VITIWLTYLLAAVAASGVFVVAGWRSKKVSDPASAGGHAALPCDRSFDDSDVDLASSHSQTDIGAAIRLALKRLSPVMAAHAVHAEIAAPLGLFVRMRSAALVDLLEDLVAAAVHAAPASRLLLTATAFGDRIYVGVTDDVPGANPAVRAGSVRSLVERAASRGGVLEVDVRPDEGTTLTLRLAAAGVGQVNMDRPLPEPAQGLAAAVIPMHAVTDQLR